MATMIPAEPALSEIGDDDARTIFDAAAQRHLHMTGAQFLAAWDRGEFEPDPDSKQGVMDVAILLPLVR